MVTQREKQNEEKSTKCRWRRRRLHTLQLATGFDIGVNKMQLDYKRRRDKKDQIKSNKQFFFFIFSSNRFSKNILLLMWRMLHIMHPPNRCVYVGIGRFFHTNKHKRAHTRCVTSIIHTHLHDDDDGSMWPTYVRSLTCTFLLGLLFQNLNKKQLLPRSFARMNIINGARAHTHARE